MLRLDFGLALALALEKVSTQTPDDVKSKNLFAGIEVLYFVLRRISKCSSQFSMAMLQSDHLTT